jgi:hypothetical protein
MGLLDGVDEPLHGVLDQGRQLAGERLQLRVLVRTDLLQLQRQHGLPLRGHRLRLERLNGLLERRPSLGSIASEDGRPKVQVPFVQGMLCGSTDPGEEAADERGHDERGWVHSGIPSVRRLHSGLTRLAGSPRQPLCPPSRPPRAVRHRRAPPS